MNRICFVFILSLLINSAHGQKRKPIPEIFYPAAGKWETRTADQVGMDADKLKAAVAVAIAAETSNPRSMEENHYRTFGKEPFGDAIGHWEKDVFVVETTNFTDDTWFGENGYFHSDQMKSIERLWLDGKGNLVYQATVEDPGVLTKPWTNFARVIPPNNDPIEESPKCKEDDATRLQNSDHHLQR